jgi:uncharacterized protein YbjT (DUF2867 family)
VTNRRDFADFAELGARRVIIEPMRILLSGTSGFVGSALLPHLLNAGHEVRALARSRVRFSDTLSDLSGRPGDEVELIIGDVLSGDGLARALKGVEVAYYLIHSMEPAHGDDRFAERDRLAAENFAAAARAAGVQRLVYLGGLLPHERSPSPHLASRHVVERILMGAVPDSVALRASIVIGARSRPFRFLVRLVERLPVVVLPAWRRFRTQPVDERDIIQMLLSAATNEAVGGGTLDVGGPDVLSYEEIIKRIADLMLLARPTVGLGLTATPITARLAAVLADESPELFLPLMEGLTADLLAADDRAAHLLDVQLHSFDAAVEHALGEWEMSEPLAAR